MARIGRRRTGGSDDTLEGDIRICDEAGTILAELRGVRAQALNRSEDGVEANLDRWFYEYGWLRRETESVEASAPVADRRLLLLDRRGVGERVGRALHASGAEILRVRRGDAFADLGDGTFRVPPGDGAEVVRLLRAVDPASLSGIVCFWALDADEGADPVGIETVAGGLSLIQALAEVGSERPAPLFLITRGAQPVLPDETETALAQAPLIGLIRVAINEYHEQPFRAVDLDPNDDALPRLLRELATADGEEEIAYRDGERYVRRLNRTPGAELAAAAPSRWLQDDPGEPAAGEVAVAVRGCSLDRNRARRLGQSSGAAGSELFATGTIMATVPAFGRRWWEIRYWPFTGANRRNP